MVLGIVVVAVGKEVWKRIPPQAEHLATSLILIGLGVFFALPHLGGHRHHAHGDLETLAEDGCESGVHQRIAASGTIIGTLVLGMTLSPCLDLLSVYVAASTLSWTALIGLSVILALTTLTIMAGLVWLTLQGLARLNLQWLEKNEGLAIGAVLVLLGILLFFV